MRTENLVERLTAELTPVRRLARPEIRLARWLLLSMPASLLVAWSFGFRPDLLACLGDRAFQLEEAAAVLTAIVGAYAALCAGLPDQPGWKVWLPLAPMAVWLGVLGQQCLAVVLLLGPAGLQITADPLCFPAIVMGGLIPAVAIVAMLRRAGMFRVSHACLCGAMSAAALGAAALRLFHTQDAAIMVIVWQLGSVVLFSLIAGALGRLLVHDRSGGILTQ